ncbi:general substrate transporter [Panaeolus papilionaceus]|nr:general substrate transporter [Panaeolus papilionaceus]
MKDGQIQPSLFKNIRVYWLAFVVYWGIVLFGYDTGVGGGVVGNVHFGQAFGIIDPSGVKNQHKSDTISSNVVSVLQAGAFFGALGSAPMSSRIGRRYTLFTFSLIFCVGAILTTVAGGGKKGLDLIYGGRVISGIGIGGISAVAPAYVSECAPKEVRGRITGLFQIMVAIGVMLSYFINLGVGLHLSGVSIWRVPFGLQLVPAGIMVLGLLTVKESPRFLASVERNEEALQNLAYLRREPVTSPAVLNEMAEIEAAIREERESRKGLGLKEAFFGKGNFIRFVIAFTIFLLQQWAGQNSVNYYAPQIFESIGYVGTKNGLLASGIYGIVKVVATSIFIFFGVETLGRKLSLFISAMGMGTLFFIVGAILKTHPPQVVAGGNPPPASKAMGAMLYIYVTFYSMGWGPLPWVYVSDIFPTRTRHYGLAFASASQWLWNFVISKVTPQIKTALGYKMFLMFATINIAGMGTFSLLIPETKGRSLEEMDIIFGAISAEQRQADVDRVQREHRHEPSTRSASTENKV